VRHAQAACRDAARRAGGCPVHTSTHAAYRERCRRPRWLYVGQPAAHGGRVFPYTSGTKHMHQHPVTPKGSEGEQAGTCDHSHCSQRFTCACSPLWTLSTSPCSLTHAVSCARRFELQMLPVFQHRSVAPTNKKCQHDGTSVLWRKPWRTHLESSVVMGSSLLDCPAAQIRYTVSTLVAAAAAVRCHS
jgi:hypothetical protein